MGLRQHPFIQFVKVKSTVGDKNDMLLVFIMPILRLSVMKETPLCERKSKLKAI
jgi:hypothetical protein